ncbi:DUF805 domain-containing protein [Corynebacterium sp. AOP12-C2-36]|uniref:DUF805 domain-containing protein n=1 Tax=Corynebacterium sp. AOP12-C2-36 TaxID=3457723 RepID=UPI004034B8F4
MPDSSTPYPPLYGPRPHTPPHDDPDILADPHYGISFSQAILRAFHKSIDFKGYASRGEYWWFFLFTFATSFLLTFLSTAFISQRVSDVLGMAAFLVFLVPSLSLLWRRLHDAGFSGLWFFISVIPIIGGIVVFIMLLLPTRTEKRSPAWDHPAQTTLTPQADHRN